MVKARTFFAGIALLFVAICLPSFASAQTTSGGISGIVSGDQGVLMGAQIQIRSTTTGFTRTVTTGSDGRYFVTGLEIGSYDVIARRI